MIKYITFLLSLFLVSEHHICAATSPKTPSNQASTESVRKSIPATPKAAESTGTTMRGGWYPWKPYQYLTTPGEPSSLTGLDVDLSRIIFERVGKGVDITEIGWKDHQSEIAAGKRDFAMGAFDTAPRRELFHISEYYRYEENSFTFSRKMPKSFAYPMCKNF